MNNLKNKLKSAILGLAVGDALGLPVEFQPREYLKENPITGMIGYGTFNQPPGTWSDDTSLTLCTLDAIKKGYDLNRIAENFVKWFDDGFWTPFGEVFDIGKTTKAAILNLKSGMPPTESGLITETSNGNGSLMRIIAVLPAIYDKPIEERFSIVYDVSSITHHHPRSVLACFIYMEFAVELLTNPSKLKAWSIVGDRVRHFILNEYDYERYWIDPMIEANEIPDIEFIYYKHELDRYSNRILKNFFMPIDVDFITTDGYVVNTLNASIRCILTTNNYSDAVLKAINLGLDTDTTGAVTGALAGLMYGYETIPEEWINALARKDDILELLNSIKI